MEFYEMIKERLFSKEKDEAQTEAVEVLDKKQLDRAAEELEIMRINDLIAKTVEKDMVILIEKERLNEYDIACKWHNHVFFSNTSIVVAHCFSALEFYKSIKIILGLRKLDWETIDDVRMTVLPARIACSILAWHLCNSNISDWDNESWNIEWNIKDIGHRHAVDIGRCASARSCMIMKEAEWSSVDGY